MEEEDEDGRPGIQSVEIAAHILKALAPAGHPIPLRELAQRCGFPTGKVHRYLVSLTRAGLVDQEPDTGFYGVGRGAVAIGLAGLWAASPTREAAHAIASLRDQTGETAFASIWTDAGPVVSLLEESARPVYMNIRVGALLSITASASGRAYAAYLPPEVVARAERVRGAQQPGPSEPAAATLTTELQTVRQSGYAFVEGLTVSGINAVAAPVRSYRGRVVIVIGLLGRADDLSPKADSPAVRALLSTARTASEALGYLPSDGADASSAQKPK